MKRIWKVKTNLTQEKNRKLVVGMTDQEHAQVAESRIDLSVDLIEGEGETITTFMVCERESVDAIAGLLAKYEFSAEVEDVTDFFAPDGKLDGLTDELIYQKLGV